MTTLKVLRCEAKTQKGNRCSKNATDDTEYCKIHLKNHISTKNTVINFDERIIAGLPDDIWTSILFLSVNYMDNFRIDLIKKYISPNTIKNLTKDMKISN